MSKCERCQRETDRRAVVYVSRLVVDPKTGLAFCPPERVSGWICSDCTQEHIVESGKSGILFYLALQLCWLSVLKLGLLTPLGILAAFIGTVALLRLLIKLSRLLLQRLRPGVPLPGWLLRGEEYELEASEVLKDLMLKEQNDLGNTVLSLREYRRKFRE